MAGNPFIESFTYPGNKKRIFVALFGITGVLTTIWYTAFFSGMSFLKGPMRMEDQAVNLILLVSGLLSMGFYVIVGRWSDRVGRKKPIIIGALASLALLFPIFWAMGALANPGLRQAAAEAPVVVTGTQCDFDAFAQKQETGCGRLLQDLTALGVPYTLTQEASLAITVGPDRLDLAAIPAEGQKAALQSFLEARGYSFAKQVPPFVNLIGIVGLLLALGLLSALTYGSVAAFLSEMFPPQIRYSSMSIPYHIGAGYLGGFLPLIATYIVASTGDVYAGLWYTWAVVAVGVVVAWWGLPEGPPKDFADD
jgi:MFS family permease